ncbi:hypothetical protein Taro_045320 [Colocasia esculenta]|uniref:Uncharacterized protein n=1 Tax=Colocasia esculenta TaxID=4460 RepID=A0A843WP54_COLES|nr:hypothetical protein [Colocasia esculenta]
MAGAVTGGKTLSINSSGDECAY